MIVCPRPHPTVDLGKAISQGAHVLVRPAVLLGYFGAWESTAPLCVLILIPTVGLTKGILS